MQLQAFHLTALVTDSACSTSVRFREICTQVAYHNGDSHMPRPHPAQLAWARDCEGKHVHDVT